MRRARRVALAAVPIAFIGWFLVWPLLAIVGRGLAPGGDLSLRPLLAVVTTPSTRRIIGFTLEQAVLSTLATLLVGLPAAWALHRRSWRGAATIRSLTIVPFVLPTIVMAAAWTAVLGPGGPLASWQMVPSLTAIVLAHATFNVAVVVRLVGPAWARLDRRAEDAARALGAPPTTVLRTVTLPALARPLVGATAITFLFASTSFGVVLQLGGIGQRTVETEIYRLTTQELALDRAAALVVVQIIAIAITLTIAARAERGAARFGVVARSPIVSRRPDAAALGALAPAALLLAVPVVALVQRSFDGGLVGYRTLGTDSSLLGTSPLAALRHSIVVAAAATVVAVVIGGCASVVLARPGRRVRLLDGLVLLPLGVSAVTVGYGFLIALDRPVDLRVSWWIVPLAHATVALPFVVRATVPALRSVDPRSRDAAAVLGAAPRVVWRTIDLPVARRALVVAAGFAAAVSLGEFGASAFIARPGAPTAPLAIYRLLGRPGTANATTAYALAVVLAATIAAVTVAAERAGRGEVLA